MSQLRRVTPEVMFPEADGSYLRRIDGTQIGSLDIAIRQAVAAVYFKRPTKDLQDLIAKDNLTFVLSLPNVTAAGVAAFR